MVNYRVLQEKSGIGAECGGGGDGTGPPSFPWGHCSTDKGPGDPSCHRAQL